MWPTRSSTAADAVMLSAETASGLYPREAVAMMARIVIEAETSMLDSPAPRSMMPYSLASSAVNQRSRSESASICSTGLAGVEGDALGHEPLDVDHLLGLDRDVGRLAADAAGGLVHHDRGVRQGVALALGAGAQQELAHRGGQAHADVATSSARTASCRRSPCRP